LPTPYSVGMFGAQKNPPIIHLWGESGE